MSAHQLNTDSSSENPRRRRRQATACTSCRNRRVRCDRMRPACLQCSRRGQVCEYISTPLSRIEFVTEPPHSLLAATNDLAVPSETWKSVFASQTALVDRANLSTSTRTGTGTGTGTGQVQVREEVPFWALAEKQKPSQEPLESNESAPTTSIDPVLHISSLGEPFLSTLFSGLAPRETYLPYFENYLSTVHPLLPLCDVATLRQTYMDFWDNLSLSTSVELLVLILAILYTGAANATSSSGSRDSAIIHGMYDKLIAALDLSTYHVVSSPSALWLLRGIIIMNTFRASQLSPFTAFGFLPFAIRFAQSLRLHIYQEADASIESEYRRRLWWHLIFMDVESTVSSGLQGIIRPHGQTIQLPALDNTFPGRGEVPLMPMAIAMQGHWEWAHRMHTWLERKPEQHEIIHFGRIIEHLLDLIPGRDGSEWARVYLRMLVDRAYCMLGLRFWQLDQFKGTGCHSEVVRTSRSFLKKFLRLAELSRESGFSWFVPGLIQPIHALIILLMHLSGCAEADEESSLSRDLVDQIISLRVNRILNGSTVHIASNDTPNVIQQHNPRYRALSAMRMRVWEKFKWPVVITPNFQDCQIESSEEIKMNDVSCSQADLEVAANIYCGEQAIWNEDIIASSMPSETLSWDDWGPFMPNFFADGSYPQAYP